MRLSMLAVVALSGMALGGVPATAAPTGLSPQDSAFVTAAGYGGNFEVAGGKLAQARAASAGVKAFGARMVTDHTRAGNKLAALAGQNGATVPDGTSPARQNILGVWSRLDGKAFDCSYVPAAYLDHVGAIGLFEEEAAHGTNPDLVRFAKDTLPTLREHQQMISTVLAKPGCP
ncbi:DUF4142 domain-containing protein [Dactylosporangium sp. NPDC000555]|uniref:DUF4142 domain-containing protein n=1 Tax=Dactylosporangium sp. NPDC000555 TaxID=3154260 RepID=UPI003316F40D